jgi:ATPase complex subunit ATP10
VAHQLIDMEMGTPFPKIKARSLAGTEFTLPDVAKGQVTLVAIAFRRQAQRMLDSWLVPFERAFGEQPTVTVYEVPMIEGRIFKWMASTIDAGMRAGIPKEKHNHVVTYYGNAAKYRQILEMEDRSLGYIFLLDPEGRIRWRGEGFAEPDEIDRMITLTKEIAAGKMEG